jgi:PAS domain S-box-containing protein
MKNMQSRNQELAQTNTLLKTQIDGINKKAVKLQDEIAILKLEKSRQQRITDKLIEKNKESIAHSLALKKTKNLHAFISQVNQNILRVKESHMLFKNACKIAIKFGGFKIAWIGLFNNANTTISCVEQIGIDEEDIETFKNIQFSKSGPYAALLVKDKHIITNNISEDRLFNSWKSILDKKSIQSFMILPIKRSGEIIGCFNLYASESNYFNKEEVKLLTEVTDDISFALDIFEKEKKQQQAEQLVLLNEKRYRLLIEKSNDIKLLINIKLEIIYSSPSIKVALGYQNQELLDHPLSQIISPGDLLNFRKFVDKVIGNPGKSFNFQLQLLHANGNLIWCEGMLTNLLNEPGINSLVANFRNISEKKLAEQQRDFDQNNLAALINNTSDLMWSLDKNYQLITSNVAFNEMIKGMTGQVIEKGSTVLAKGFSGEQLSRYKTYYDRILAGEAFTETEYTPSPVEFWSVISYSPIRKDERIIGAACYAHDITELKLAERKLVHSESRLKEAQAISHMGNFDIDLVQKTEVWSDEMYNLYGIHKCDVTPSTELFYSFIHPDDLELVKSNMKEIFISFLGNSIEFRFFRNNGELRYGCSEVKFEFNEAQRPTRFFGVMQDITERKLAENENVKMINDIMLRNSDLEQFGYIISHNLRAPVANIIGASNALKDEDLTHEDKLVLNKGIHTSIMRLDDVVQDLNQILQVKSNINETRELVAFSELVDDIKESISDLIQKENIQVNYDFSAINEFLTVKPYLYSIFYNLIANSIKYRTLTKNSLIRIRSIKKPDSFQLIISDNGMGIDLVKAGNNIFGLYKRFHPSIEGKGMGLFMVKTQVEALGGKIDIKSNINEGTEFTIEFTMNTAAI